MGRSGSVDEVADVEAAQWMVRDWERNLVMGTSGWRRRGLVRESGDAGRAEERGEAAAMAWVRRRGGWG